MKKCYRCKLEKELTEFNKDKRSKDGYHNACRSCHKAQNANWWDKNKEALVIKNREWKKNNLEKIRGSRNAWFKKRCAEDPSYKLAHALRTRMNMAIKLGSKSGSAVRDLGCTIEEFKKHIELQFKPGMTWDNWGLWGNVWHIDHIKPLVSFDLTDKEQFMEACNYTNMQPLWCVENNSKADWS